VTDLQGRVALLTGASGGIGKAIAYRLAEAGADLFLTYGTHSDDAEGVAARVRHMGRRVTVIAADLSEPTIPAELIDRAHQEFGRVDILVANAGSAVVAPWSEIDIELWNATLAVNLTAPFLLAQKALPAMITRGFGRVLFISSVAGLNGGIVGAHYAASKAGLHGMMHHIAPRVAGHGVTVNALAPALIGDTRMLPTDPDSENNALPVGRLGHPEEVADMAIAMLRNGYLTNKVVTLDGGLLAR
jgi:3-oxoacyl-[acyl-carrier protein] reductase